MANETTYSSISSLVNPAWEAALMYAHNEYFMPQVVQVYTDMAGRQARKAKEYAAGTMQKNVAETDDIQPTQTFNPTLLATLTPGEIAENYFLTDARLRSDDTDVRADLVEHFGNSVGKTVESDLLSVFSSFTGGTINCNGSALTWAKVYAARAILAAAGVPKPYNVVLHEYAWNSLAVATNIAANNASPLRIRDDIQSKYYVGTVGDLNFWVTGELTAGTACVQGVFSRMAIALDVREGFRIEPQRDASKRGWELVGSMTYAYGAWRPRWGVKLLSDASTPT